MGKRIDQLDVYGSPNEIKGDDDLFEVSKNSGGPGFPVYASGDSKKITRKQLVSLLGGIPYSGFAYEVVKNVGDEITNGVNFINSVAKCYAKTPNGNALSTSNRAVVFLWPGIYDVASVTNIGQFVDFIGIGSPNDIIFKSSFSIGSIFNILSANDYSLSNMTIGTGVTGEYSIMADAGTTDNGNWDNLILTGQTSEIVWNGNYNKINPTVDNILIGAIGVNAVVCNSNFKNNSCASSQIGASDILGKVIDCTGEDYCFAFSLVDRAKIAGSIIRTIGGNYCFASTQSVGGSNGEISGVVDNCHGGYFCFAAASSAISFGVISGIVRGGCTAESSSFGFSPNATKGYITGKIDHASCSGINSCGHTKESGIISNFTGVYSNGIHLGIIERCKFISPSGSSQNTIDLGDGSTILYTKIIQLESTLDSIKIEASSNVKISHCETNKDFNTISGDSYVNLIAVPFNVVDSNISE